MLDPDRVLRDDREDMTAEDHRSQAQMLDTALHETADYAKQLWNDLAAMRQYLFDTLPAEPADGVPAGGVSPVGPDDDRGWSYWCDAFAEVTSVLCGPRGDNGYGRSSATVLAQLRRHAGAPDSEPTAALETPEAGPRADSVDDTAETPTTNADSAVGHVAHHAAGVPSEEKDIEASTFLGPLIYAALGALGATLALRKRLPRQS